MPEVQIEVGQQLLLFPARSAFRQLFDVVHFDEGDAFGRQWIIRGLRGTDDIITVEIHVSAESIVTMVVEPGVEAGAIDVRGQLLIPMLPSFPCSIVPCPTVAAPRSLLRLTPQSSGICSARCGGAKRCSLALVAGEREITEVPLYNDPSYRAAFMQLGPP